MIDSHCHLTDPRLMEQIDTVLDRASQAGVELITTIATDPQDARLAIELCHKYPDRIRCAIGIHPNESDKYSPESIDPFKEMATDSSVIAVGETGLDYYWDTVDRRQQRRLFEAQLQLAQELHKPVVIHSRQAITDTLAVLKYYPEIRCVFHCFTGSMSEADQIIESGYFLGFTGPVTFKKNDALREVLRKVPEDRILIETDGPYLSPEPVRGKKVCEPAFVQYVLAMVAKVKDLTLNQADRMTSTNTRRFYGIE